MSARAGRDWNEANLSEDPAVDLLTRFGYAYVGPEVLDSERESVKQVVLVGRLRAAVKRLNPWVEDEGIQRALRAVTSVAAGSVLEANERVHVALTHGISVVSTVSKGRARRERAASIQTATRSSSTSVTSYRASSTVSSRSSPSTPRRKS